MPFFPLFQYQAHTEPILSLQETVQEDKWHQPWSDPVRFRSISAALMAASGYFGTLGAGVDEGIFEDKWHFAWSEPIVKNKVGLRVGDQQFFAFSPLPITNISWFAELSKPQKLAKVGIGAHLQQTLAFQPTPIIDVSWFEELSKPRTLQRAGLRPAQQQFFTFAPLPLVSFAWFDNLSDPVRIKRGQRSALQQFFATDTAVIPVSKLSDWFANLSDPVRIKPGLKAALQQFYGAPPRLLPTPTVFGRLDALETKDIFLLGASVFNPPASAEIGIVDTGFPLAEIGIAAPKVASVSISIQIV